MKIAIVGNQARAVSNFWSVLIRQLIKAGHDVVCLVPSPAPGEDLAWEIALLDLGVRLRRYPLERKGLNPVNDIKTLLFLRQMLQKEQPDALFASTIKPVIYTPLAAMLARFPKKQHRHVMITGLGYTFEADSRKKKWLMRLVCWLYRTALGRVNTVFFQNNDDRALFEHNRIVPSSTTICMCRGTGVDLARFAKAPLPHGDTHFLFVGRLLEAKGLYDLYEAACILKEKHPKVRISILGPQEYGPGSVSLQEVTAWQQQGVIEYLGETQDVRPYLASAHVVVLPSWREGVPCSLMEAMSTGRPVVAANAPGSREVVQEGVNGFLVPLKDGKALANAMEQFIIQPDLITTMGAASRKMAEDVFDAELVAQQIIHDMHLPAAPQPGK